MSYSRWMFSDWYIYASIGGHIECDHVSGVFLQWTKGETLDQFIERAGKKDLSKDSIDDLRHILERNRTGMEYFLAHGELPD